MLHYEDAWGRRPVLRLTLWFGIPFALFMAVYLSVLRGSVSLALVVVIPAGVVMFGVPMALLAWFSWPQVRRLGSEARMAVVRAARTGGAVSTEEEAVALLTYTAKFRRQDASAPRGEWVHLAVGVLIAALAFPWAARGDLRPAIASWLLAAWIFASFPRRRRLRVLRAARREMAEHYAEVVLQGASPERSA